jgi:uncharacterized membrane protein
MPVMLQAVFLLQLLLPSAAVLPTVPGPAFSLGVSSTRLVMPQGGSTTLTVLLSTSEAASFKLRIDGVPAVVTANIPALKPGANIIVLRCPPNTPSGTYAIQVTAAAGQNQQTLTFALDIMAATPAP